MGDNKTNINKVAWRSPSNIALVKYWGKKGFQVPANPSLSMTLDRAVTEMEVEYSPKGNQKSISLEFYFESRKNQEFEEKIISFLKSLPERFAFLKSLHLVVRSHNTFPHSAGIASSASSMSALALCILSVEEKFTGRAETGGAFKKTASDLARQASGSACRSVYGGFAFWGRHNEVAGSDDRYAIPLPMEVHQAFTSMHDAILLVSSAKKSLSSRAGHGLMMRHPLAGARYEMASHNAEELVKALSNGDVSSFIRITEQEALTLHALMMSSEDPLLLLRPNSIGIIEKVAEFRRKSGIPVCFTIDAGPNIHLLYPGEYKNQVKTWITDDLKKFLEDGKWIDDHIGSGPVNLNEEKI